MGDTIRLTMAQAITRFLASQKTQIEGTAVPIFAGVWAIFGHGNVAGMGEALHQCKEVLPTLRAHNEQAMAHAAIAFAKASFRRRMMACTTSIGPGALNMVTAAGVAHVNRLPLLLLPGDVFANRLPDPVLQQVEDFADGTVTANDCFRPVSRYFDRITRPEQIMPALRRSMQVLSDPASCGPVTLSLCQDVQAEAFDFPTHFFDETIWNPRRLEPDRSELKKAASLLGDASRPLIIAGGGVLYSEACDQLRTFAERHNIPVALTQAGKSALPDSHPLCLGSVGVTGTSAANAFARDADVLLAVGTRLQDFTTGSWSLFQNPDFRMIGLNAQPLDAGKHDAHPMVCDAQVGLPILSSALTDWRAEQQLVNQAADLKKQWRVEAASVMRPGNASLPSDAQVIGAVHRCLGTDATLVCAAGGLPGELHKLWKSEKPGSYHLEYGFSCMGYEIAGGLGVKLAKPQEEVVVMVGDGSYLMLNSEIATSVMHGLKLIIIVLDNRGFGCINRLQMATGGANFNNLLKDSSHVILPDVDFRAHAESLGAIAEKVSSITDMEDAIGRARSNDRTTVIVIDTDPLVTTQQGGHWWDVAVPEVSPRAEVQDARQAYDKARKQQF